MLCQTRGPHEWSRRPNASVEVEALAVHLDQAGDRHLLLGVALGEAVRGAGRRLLALVVDRLTTRRLRHRGEAEVDRALLARVALERSAGVGHLARVHEHAHVAVVGDVVLLVRRDDVELQSAGVVRDVALDVRPLEHEPHPPVGQVQAHGHLRRSCSLGRLPMRTQPPSPPADEAFGSKKL